jgi:Tol biopolymer transport system component
MKPIITLFFALCFCLTLKGQDSIPQIFQPGVISKGDYESHPAFSPTGDTLYFIKCSYDLKISAICVSHKKNNRWTDAQVASFSGQYMDADPFVAKDGKTLYFMSDRPEKPGAPAKFDTDIFKVTLTANGWGVPERLPAPINSSGDEYYPTLADNGNIYFGSTRKVGLGGSDIYRCRLVDGKYQSAENLGEAINTPGNDYEAFIAPDESYLIYNSTPAGIAGLDFYISFNQNGSWTKARKLPVPISSDGIDWSPKVTRDKKLFYFSSTRNRWATLPAKPQNMQQFNERLQKEGNSLSDIYMLDLNVLMKLN